MCKLELTPLKVAVGLLVIVTGLLLGGIVTQYIRHAYGDESQLGFVRLFNLEGENNLPSWYSSVALLLSSAALGNIGLQRRQEGNSWAWHWLALAFGFLYLSADEAASIHELAGPLLHRWLDTSGHANTVISVIGTAWLLAGIPVAAIVFLMFWGFLRHLPFTTRALFLFAVTYMATHGISLRVSFSSGQSSVKPFASLPRSVHLPAQGG